MWSIHKICTYTSPYIHIPWGGIPPQYFWCGDQMKNVTGLLLVMLMHGSFFHTAIAQDGKTALVPLPSVDDFTRGEDGWALGLGLAVEYEAAYEGSDEYDFEVDPAGALQWRSGDNIFYRAGEALAMP